MNVQLPSACNFYGDAVFWPFIGACSIVYIHICQVIIHVLCDDMTGKILGGSNVDISDCASKVRRLQWFLFNHCKFRVPVPALGDPRWLGRPYNFILTTSGTRCTWTNIPYQIYGNETKPIVELPILFYNLI